MPGSRSQLVVQELDIEVRVVDDELGAADELDELGCDVGELRLRREKLVLDAVHLERAAVDLALGIDVAMEAILRRPAVDELHAADLDDPVARGRLEARWFRYLGRSDASAAAATLDGRHAGLARILPHPPPKSTPSMIASHRRPASIASRPRFASSSARSFSG